MLGERSAGTGKAPAAAEPPVEHVQHRSAELSQFHGTQRRKDRAPDVALVGRPGRNVEFSDFHVPDQQLGNRDAGVRPLPRRGLLKQAAEHDPGLVLGLHGLPESQPTAGQRIRAGVDLDTE